MIISENNKFIFFHCRKTAGSSISVFLTSYLGPNDIQIGSVHESITAGNKVTRRMLKEALIGSWGKIAIDYIRGQEDYKTGLNKSLKLAYRKTLGPKPQHAHAELVKQAFPEEFRSFVKFCVVRNPYDLAVSDYFWRTRNMANRISFSKYLGALKEGDTLGGIVPVGFYSNWPIYTIDDKIVMEHVARYENFKKEITQILEKIGISPTKQIGNQKTGFRKKSESEKDYRGMYNTETKKLVENLYEKEIETFGYCF